MITQTRKRTPIALILYALYLYFLSLSLRRASHVLEPIIKRSHVTIFINETEINVREAMRRYNLN